MQISGFGVLAVGVWTLYDKHLYAELLPSATYEVTTYLLLATAVIILLIGFVGCFGAAKEIPTLLYIVSPQATNPKRGKCRGRYWVYVKQPHLGIYKTGNL